MESKSRKLKFTDLKDMLKQTGEIYGDRPAYVFKTEEKDKFRTITHSEFREQINELGTVLIKMGLKDKRIAVISENRYEWELSYLAISAGVGVVVPLDKALPANELESLILRSQVEAIIYSSKYDGIMNLLREKKNTNLKYFISMDLDENTQGIYSEKALIEKGKKLISEGNTEYLDAKIDPDKMGIMLFTSGTTSKSKAVMLSQWNVASNVYAMLLVEEFLPTDVNLAFLPFHHIFGSTEMIVMLASGLATAFPDGLRYVAQNLKEYKISLFVGVPLLVEAIYRNIEKEIEKQGKTKLIERAKKISNVLLKLHIDVRKKLFKPVLDALGGNMRFIISGGAPLDKKVAKGFNDIGIELVQGYGLTETAPVIAAENHKKKKSGSIGFPMDNVELEIVNKDENGIGELRVKGPNVMLGYYENEEETKKVIKDGWFYTGDLGYIDSEGFIFLTGRQKDMIVLKNGKKVFPEELETLINRLELVKESIVFGMPDEKDKNDLKLSVKIVYDTNVAKEKYPECSEEDLKKIIWEQIKEINKTFPPYKYIKNMILTDQELIKTTTQKVKRHEEIKRILGK